MTGKRLAIRKYGRSQPAGTSASGKERLKSRTSGIREPIGARGIALDHRLHRPRGDPDRGMVGASRRTEKDDPLSCVSLDTTPSSIATLATLTLPLFANAAMAVDRVASYPCVGVRS